MIYIFINNNLNFVVDILVECPSTIRDDGIIIYYYLYCISTSFLSFNRLSSTYADINKCLMA